MAFDLRKQPNVEPARKKPYWIYVLLPALLLSGAAAWWFNQPKVEKALAAVPVKDSVPKATDTTTATAATTTTTATAPAAVDTPIIAASFDAGSTSPKGATRMLSKLKERSGKIKVLGYASSEGSLAVNQSISQARADAYKTLLVKHGVADSLVTAEGKGIDNPIASNDTEDGRRKNRRVEVQYQH